jgi:hypothetical protein
MSYSSYVPARINEKNCIDGTCPVKVLPPKKTVWTETQVSMYVNIVRNSRKKHTDLSREVNQYGSASGAPSGYGAPPRNKF